MPVDARAALRGYAEGDHPPTSVASGAAEGEGAGTGDVEMQEGGPGAETGKGAAGAVPGEGAVTGKQGRAQATRAVMWEGGEGDGGGPGAAEQLRVGCAPDHHGLLLASTFGETRVFQTGTRLREATEELSAQLPGESNLATKKQRGRRCGQERLYLSICRHASIAALLPPPHRLAPPGCLRLPRRPRPGSPPGRAHSPGALPQRASDSRGGHRGGPGVARGSRRGRCGAITTRGVSTA